MSEIVRCEVCGRLYGRDPGDAPLPASEASWAALRAGWQPGQDGQDGQDGPGPDAA